MSQDETRSSLELLYNVSRELASALEQRVVLQRVSEASVTVDGGEVARIGRGYTWIAWKRNELARKDFEEAKQVEGYAASGGQFLIRLGEDLLCFAVFHQNTGTIFFIQRKERCVI